MFKFMLFGYVSEHMDTYKMTMFLENLMIHLNFEEICTFATGFGRPWIIQALHI